MNLSQETIDNKIQFTKKSKQKQQNQKNNRLFIPANNKQN